ncbi:MAG: sigma-54 dependent transcriptional regulator [Gammaproteobacteria bacterium]|nr:sigma-54 dependent transcriptional regulator [Gammaproteobacteria bacterium]MBU1554977.1 sigma-54 dependent transcriptional regulator [Gammaproteobacteria bacterium]MBU2070497.1 sigma-54 dependent transcriptional regulator [Gammaproteobacteria bacterium]MBU2185298.1 sigma-54 dependent transcriptional regulator [Gammaproteobacteria bacterium]MBU2205089.1 sigma-54 dependent transcriptional regulator [Gammaproteobacteria bacterium]
MSAERILLIDDEPAFCQLAQSWLQHSGYQVQTAADLPAAKLLLPGFKPDLVLLDLSLPPEFDPQYTLSQLGTFTQQPVIILTGHAQRQLALDAIALGAWDFIAKPVDPDLLAVVIKRALSKHQLDTELSQLKQQQQGALQQLIGASPAMAAMRTLIQRIAPTDVRVLVTGPSGTGKEVVSRALHQLSRRANQPFVSVHCGAIPAELLESELFGYVKGAFTGADKDRPGLLQLADKGTLFLDEIGEMPLPMQVKLLRVLQEGTYFAVGGRQQQKIDLRLISATNANLPELVKKGLFREDLYYRIKGITLETVALAERKQDIPLLLQFFLQQQAKQQGQSLKLDSTALNWFIQRDWPGNVRELKNTLESVAAVAQGGVLSMADISLLHPQALNLQAMLPLDSSQMSLEQAVQQLEIKMIKHALQQCKGNKSQAARELGLSRQGLLKKIDRYRLAD